MAYLNKDTLLQAYKVLSTNTEDPSTQGATQLISAVRYLFALDQFYSNEKRNCDTKIKTDKDSFVNNVGQVVSLSDGTYTANFHLNINPDVDYKVGSNFFSVNAVKDSLVNPSIIVGFPRRTPNIMTIQNGILLRDKTHFTNINSYLTSEVVRVAFALWLVRNEDIVLNIPSSLSWKDIRNVLLKKYTPDLVDELVKPSSTCYDDYCVKYGRPTMQPSKAEISKNDIMMLLDSQTPAKNKNVSENVSSIPLQTIFYGAPGTGKSYKVKSEILAGVPEENIFRTTFHPDYDYASFVGCYKPTISRNKKNVSLQTILDYDTLVAKYKELLAEPTSNVNQASTLLGYKYHDSIVQMQNSGHSIAQLVKDAYKDNTTYDTVVRNGMACYEENLPLIQKENQITYSFIPQVFTKAYIKAWEIIAKDEKVTVKVKKEDGTETEQEIFKPVYLVIEEINRGNCAQIFGDLFQLLDRNENGYSEYPIDIDEDLKNYLVQQLGADSEGIKDGKLCLPPNLNLLATMNTSDQSLFPMDSAFKRRWDWEYVPIRYTAAEAKDDKDNFHTFTITIDDKHHYLWTDFLQKVNAKILSVTDSEDKQMGEYFIKKSINQDEFINKVMYYLWSEVGKDNFNSTNNALFVLPDGLIKETKDGKEEDKKEFSFNELFKDNATKLLQGFMKKLEVKSEEEKAATPTPATPAEV